VPPVIKKIVVILILLIVVNAGFVWYGQASFNATFEQLSKAFAENNATLPSSARLPDPIARYIEQSGQKAHLYRTLVLQIEGDYRKKPTKKPAPLHALLLLRPSADMLWAARLEANAAVTFNALESYHNGHAKLQALLFGIIPTGTLDSPAFARSELARLLAYGLFNPALLSRDIITYRILDNHRVEATIRDGELKATVRFRFDANGRALEAVCDHRLLPGQKEKTARWILRVKAYGQQDGLNLPLEIEELWQNEGEAPWVFSRYRITGVKRL
jgi:hypothetical protein